MSLVFPSQTRSTLWKVSLDESTNVVAGTFLPIPHTRRKAPVAGHPVLQFWLFVRPVRDKLRQTFCIVSPPT